MLVDGDVAFKKSSTHLKEVLFKPKPGFTCKDWPDSKELNWFEKTLGHSDIYESYDTVCRIKINVHYEVSFNLSRDSPKRDVEKASIGKEVYLSKLLGMSFLGIFST